MRRYSFGTDLMRVRIGVCRIEQNLLLLCDFDATDTQNWLLLLPSGCHRAAGRTVLRGAGRLAVGRFSVSGPTICNSLPLSLRGPTSFFFRPHHSSTWLRPIVVIQTE